MITAEKFKTLVEKINIPHYRQCIYCDEFHESAHHFEMDHFPIPRRHGGSKVYPACKTCHNMKDRFDSGTYWHFVFSKSPSIMFPISFRWQTYMYMIKVREKEYYMGNIFEIAYDSLSLLSDWNTLTHTLRLLLGEVILEIYLELGELNEG